MYLEFIVLRRSIEEKFQRFNRDPENDSQIQNEQRHTRRIGEQVNVRFGIVPNAANRCDVDGDNWFHINELNVFS
jgi:hypothetical protein